MNTHPISARHAADVLRLNEESVDFLSPLSPDRLVDLLGLSAFHRVVEAGGQIVGFVIALRQGAAYDSENYQWFDSRYPDFLYVDRVVIAKNAQVAGMGSILYRELFLHARARDIPIVTCEFDIDPPNPGSARFHRKFGFTEVGRQRVQHGKKWVSLQLAQVGLAKPGA